jgi:hypothetical protein
MVGYRMMAAGWLNLRSAEILSVTFQVTLAGLRRSGTGMKIKGSTSFPDEIGTDASTDVDA